MQPDHAVDLEQGPRQVVGHPYERSTTVGRFQGVPGVSPKRLVEKETCWVKSREVITWSVGSWSWVPRAITHARFVGRT